MLPLHVWGACTLGTGDFVYLQLALCSLLIDHVVLQLCQVVEMGVEHLWVGRTLIACTVVNLLQLIVIGTQVILSGHVQAFS